jgi:hypothetical protein
MNEQKKAVILNSRQPLGTSGSSDWVKKTIEAVLWIKQQGFVLVTSVGMQTWEIVLFLAVKYSIPGIILIPCSRKECYLSQCRYYTVQFGLDISITEFLPVEMGDESTQVEILRDQTAIGLSDCVVPVSIRKSGSMNQLLSLIDKTKLQNKFLISYKPRSIPLYFDYTVTETVNIELTAIAPDFIFHWTRTTYNPWPDELLADYYNDIVDSICYPRTASKTLEHILESGRIIGSGRHMPDNERCVSFTGKQPVDFIALMRWRKRYREMSFEPYGIGIRKSEAFAGGVKKVTYIDSSDDKKDEVHWLRQSVGKKGNWTVEDEYRHKGDFPVFMIDRKDVLIICAIPDEALGLSEKFGINAVSMFKE